MMPNGKLNGLVNIITVAVIVKTGKRPLNTLYSTFTCTRSRALHVANADNVLLRWRLYQSV